MYGKSVFVIFVLRECTWNASAVSLVLPATNDTVFPDYPPRRMVYHTSVSSLVTVSRFLRGNREAELKPTTFSSFLFSCFPASPILLTPQRYSTFECCLLGLLINNDNDNNNTNNNNINIYLLNITSSHHRVFGTHRAKK